MADRVGRKPLIVWGMLVQAAGHAVIGLGLAAPLVAGLVGSLLLGLGTAMVYPALLAAVRDVGERPTPSCEEPVPDVRASCRSYGGDD